MKQPRTLQEIYEAIQMGKGHKDVFLKEAKRLYSGLIPNAATFEQTVHIFKNRGVLNENYIDLKPSIAYEDTKQERWEKTFKNFLKEAEEESIKAETTKQSGYVENVRKNSYDNSDVKNLDNQIGQEVLNGIYFEGKENPDKTLDELRGIVSKNLAKDPLYYVKNAMFGIKGVGYTDDIPGLKASKSDQMEKVKMKSLNESKYDFSNLSVRAQNFISKLKLDGKPITNLSQLKSYFKKNDIDSSRFSAGPYNLGREAKNELKKILNESKQSSQKMLDKKLKDIDSASAITTLEVKIQAIEEEISRRQDRINMIDENEELAELVNPVKLREMKKDIKILERNREKLQKIYEKMTGSKKKEIIDEDPDIEEVPVEEESLTENVSPEDEDFKTLVSSFKEYLDSISREEMFDKDGNYNPTLKQFHNKIQKYANDGDKKQKTIANFILSWI